MVIIIGEETLDKCDFYHYQLKDFKRSIIQIIVSDPNPDDSRYIKLLKEKTVTIPESDKVIVYSVEIDNVAPYTVEYDEEGNSQVTMNFFSKD